LRCINDNLATHFAAKLRPRDNVRRRTGAIEALWLLALEKSIKGISYMRVAVRVSALLVATCAVAGPVFAVEPQAPEKLITANEAVLIAIRSRLNQWQLPSRPTQNQKGEAIDRAGLSKFYATLGDNADENRRRPLWVTETGLSQQAREAIQEIANAAEWGLPPEAFLVPSENELSDRQLRPTEMIALEMKMSLAILKYARYARGGRMDPTDLSLDIDRKPPLLAADYVLRGVQDAADVSAFLQGLHPKHDQFVKLRAAYLKALDDEADGVDTIGNAEQSGRNKKRRKSKRGTLLSKRLLYNMEMWRWMPADLGDTYINPNVPEFRIRVVKDNRIIHSERIVTGKVANKTPIFSDELETIVFRPNWGIPNSIKVKEILPKIMSGKGIAQQGFRVQYGGREVDPGSVNWGAVDIRNYHIYQPPGRRNALGLVKFLFPNKHAVYFHDTPSKYLFNKKSRAFSHGCMRVRNPMKLAAVLFNEDRGWPSSKIKELSSSGINNQQISLNRKIPVHVTYFTARADEDGEIKLVKDIYGHEKRIQIGFDGKAHTIVKENRSLEKYLAARVSSSSQYAYDEPQNKKDREWMRNIWGNN
jgi:L,D-transpeptidase YcbB